jgi:hypothetical protein
MNKQNTLYIAEPIFSELLQNFDSEASFPPIKKIGITTDHPKRREKELLGTKSPVKISIVKAWTGLNARSVETMLHTILDNTRLDGEYFWDGNETLVDAVTGFINTYHPDADEIIIDDDLDVKAASASVTKKNSRKIYEKVVPELERLKIKYIVTQSENSVRFKLSDYRLDLGVRTGDRYTLTIWSKSKTTEETLEDFPGSQELSANSTEDSSRRGRIPMTSLESILSSLKQFTSPSTN